MRVRRRPAAAAARRRGALDLQQILADHHPPLEAHAGGVDLHPIGDRRIVVPEARQRHAREDQLSGDAVPAIDPVCAALRDDDLGGGRAGSSRPWTAAGAEEDQPRLPVLRSRAVRQPGARCEQGAASEKGTSIEEGTHLRLSRAHTIPGLPLGRRRRRDASRPAGGRAHVAAGLARAAAALRRRCALRRRRAHCAGRWCRTGTAHAPAI
jgi:hypothetical protein